MWIRILAATMVLVSLSKTSLHPGVQMGTCEGRDGNCVLLSSLRYCHLAARAAYSPGS